MIGATQGFGRWRMFLFNMIRAHGQWATGRPNPPAGPDGLAADDRGCFQDDDAQSTRRRGDSRSQTRSARAHDNQMRIRLGLRVHTGSPAFNRRHDPSPHCDQRQIPFLAIA